VFEEMADDRAQVPVWLLDVDGVLNATRPGWRAPPRLGDASAGGFTFTIRWAPPLIERIALLHEAGRVEVRWATSWVVEIRQIERLLRLPTFPTAFAQVDTRAASAVIEAKGRAALDVVEGERRPLIWTDDDAIPTTGPLRDRITGCELPVLLLAPDSRRGLQPGHVRAIEEFVADPWA
jgi:hypothetical protein